MPFAKSPLFSLKIQAELSVIKKKISVLLPPAFFTSMYEWKKKS